MTDQALVALSVRRAGIDNPLGVAFAAFLHGRKSRARLLEVVRLHSAVAVETGDFLLLDVQLMVKLQYQVRGEILDLRQKTGIVTILARLASWTHPILGILAGVQSLVAVQTGFLLPIHMTIVRKERALCRFLLKKRTGRTRNQDCKKCA